jgi:hypothetical protein
MRVLKPQIPRTQQANNFTFSFLEKLKFDSDIWNKNSYTITTAPDVGLGSSVGIANGYGLVGAGITIKRLI